NRSPKRGRRRSSTLAMAAPSASRPRRRPSGLVASRIRSVCTPPATVAAMRRLPDAGESIEMTSSASTGRCPSFISPPPTTDGSRADPGSACGARLDPQPLEGLRERLRVLEGPAVVVPAGRGPDLGVVARPDDDGLGVETGHVAQVVRDEDPALAVEGRLDGAGEDEPLE